MHAHECIGWEARVRREIKQTTMAAFLTIHIIMPVQSISGWSTIMHQMLHTSYRT